MIKETLRPDLEIKWARIRSMMTEQGADACLLSVGVNLYYTTGVNYNGYFYLSTECDEPILFVKAPAGLMGDGVHYIRKQEQISEVLAVISVAQPKKLLLEADELTFNDYSRLAKCFEAEEIGNATALMRRVRMVKTPWEIDQFKHSAALHAKTYAEIKRCYRKGMTDVEFQVELERVMRLNGSIGLFRAFGSNMDIFMGSTLAGDNAGAPSPFDYALGGAGTHPSLPLGANGTLLEKGMSVMIDLAGNYTAYVTDMTRTCAVGEISDEARRAHAVSCAIVAEIERVAKPGFSCAEMYNIAARMADEAGLAGNFMGTKQQAKFVGHGIGLQINEMPVLTPRSRDVLEVGMVFALEPKFVLDGIGAVGIENSYIVTETGLETLTVFPEEIIELA